MKKLFCILLILFLIPVFSFADDPDPIIGCWYLYYDSSLAPELSSSFPDTDKAIGVYIYNSDGTIYVLEADISDNKCTPKFGVHGKWQNINGLYVVSTIGAGKTTAIVTDDALYLKILDSDLSVAYKKMHYFDPYADYIRK